MKTIRKLSVIILSLILISNSFINVFAVTYTVENINRIIDNLLSYEYNYTNTNSLEDFVENYLAPNAGEGECDWFVISLGRNGTNFNSNLYVNNLNKVISDIYKNGVKNAKITDLQRISLVYTACNKDIKNILGYNLLADCTYNRELSELSSQGIMTLDYALILLDSKNFHISQNALTTRDDIVAKILSLQLDNGGFALTGTAPDADVTAMTVTALCPYIKNNKTVKSAVDKALIRLSKMQKNDGSFASYGKLNCESTAQVAVMLTSLGIDPENDERFIKNGYSVVDALLSYQTQNGGFMHLKNGNENQMATYQAFYALVAYKSFISTSQGLYNFTDENNPQQTVTEPKTDFTNKDIPNSQAQNSNSNNNNYYHNNNSDPQYVYEENTESANNQYDSSNQNNNSRQSSSTENSTSPAGTSVQSRKTPTVESSENVSSNNTATSDEVNKNRFAHNINNFNYIKEFNNEYGTENLSVTGIAAFIMLSGYILLNIYKSKI